MKPALLRGATAGCVGALALAAILVLSPSSGGDSRLDESLRRSGVVVVNDPGRSSGPFAQAGESLRLAGLVAAYGVAAGALFGWAVDRFGHPLRWAAAGLLAAVSVLLLAGWGSVQNLGGQVGFWAATVLWFRWSSPRQS